MSLREKITHHIQTHGPLTVAEYMTHCLYDTEQGYYMTHQPFGAEGDFITAPELTQLFGDMLGLWVADTWRRVLGAPAHFTLLEMGPGRGTLMADMLAAIARAAPECLAAMRVEMLEISPYLRHLQQQKLRGSQAPIRPPIHWLDGLPTAPYTTPVIALGNELLDAFPVHQFVRQGSSYHERLIGLKDGKLAFVSAPEATTNITGDAEIVEDSPAADGFVGELQHKLGEHGVLLLLDYGGDGEGDTLQALRRHQHEDPLANPGEADLTTHVNFRKLRAILANGPAGKTHGPTPMGLFLTELGLPLRAAQAHEAAPDAATREHIETATHRLLAPAEMGQHFQVMAWLTEKRTQQAPAGFAHAND